MDAANMRVTPKGKPIPERCERCNDAPWSKRHRTGWYCTPCAALARADTCRQLGVTPDIGFAVPVRRDHDTPDGWWCICTTCPAEWVDTPGVQCWRCEERVARQIAAQIRTVLTPPDDFGTAESETEWESRLQTAVDLGLITHRQAVDAFKAALARLQDGAA